MNNSLYISLTNAVSLISSIGIIILVVIFIIKRKIKPLNIFLLLLFAFGIYLYFPMKYLTLGNYYQKPEIIELALKLSVNPYEKRLGYKYLAEIYADDIFYQNIKDGSKAIEYMELALKGKYSKYQEEAGNLAFWYSIKGDKENTFKIAQYLKNSNIQKRNIYIMEDDYKKALETFSDNDKGIENYLKADLYRKLGNQQEAIKAQNIADNMYNSVLKNIKIRARKIEFKENAEKYKSTTAYKNWILAQKKAFGF